MKALTLWQPWASLVADGAKQVETRPWSTSYRGPLAIHAGANRLSIHDNLVEWDDTFATWIPRRAGVPHVPRGAVIATVDLVDVVPTNVVHMLPMGEVNDGWERGSVGDGAVFVSEAEWHFGNYGGGRFAWLLRNATWLRDPVPCRGKQRLWNWDQP